MEQTTVIPVIDIGPWTLVDQNVFPTGGGGGGEDILNGRRQEVVHAIGRACEEVGFFAIQNHGVDPWIVEAAERASEAFFDLPTEEKQSVSFADQVMEYPYGYENCEVLSQGKQTEQQQQQQNQSSKNGSINKITDNDSSTTPGSSRKTIATDNDDTNNLPLSSFPDLKETFSIGPYNAAAGMPPRRFPQQPAELEPALTAYYEAMERLACQLLEIMAVALNLPDSKTWFVDKMDHHLSALRILNYFPIDRRQARQIQQQQQQQSNETVVTQQQQLRASAHTDYGTLTILKSNGPGLQVKKDSGDHAETGWVDVPHFPNAFIINLGDLMRRWTNDRWLSTLHRVVIDPPIMQTVLDDDKSNDPAAEDEIVVPRRQSIAYFVNVNGDCLVDTKDLNPRLPSKYSPITAKEHLMAKHAASMGVTTSAIEI